MSTPARPADRGSVRFGTLVVDVAFDHPRYRGAMASHLRAVVHAPVAHPGLRLDIVDRAAPMPPARGADALIVQRNGQRTSWATGVATATLDRSGAVPHATLEVHAAGQHEEVVLHYVTVLVHKVLQTMGLVRLHAAGVVTSHRTALFVGDKGAGKSTIALAMGRKGATVLGDDQLALQRAAGGITIAGSDGGIRLTAQTEAHFFEQPLEIEPVVQAGVAKKEASLGDVVTADVHRAHPPTHLYFPTVAGALAIHPMRRRDALQRLVAATVPHHRFADGPDRVDLVEQLSALVEATTVAELQLSRDLADLDRLWVELSS